jgi:hypothetical protein
VVVLAACWKIGRNMGMTGLTVVVVVEGRVILGIMKGMMAFLVVVVVEGRVILGIMNGLRVVVVALGRVKVGKTVLQVVLVVPPTYTTGVSFER